MGPSVFDTVKALTNDQRVRFLIVGGINTAVGLFYQTLLTISIAKEYFAIDSQLDVIFYTKTNATLFF